MALTSSFRFKTFVLKESMLFVTSFENLNVLEILVSF